jgi:hypothetical protein
MHLRSIILIILFVYTGNCFRVNAQDSKIFSGEVAKYPDELSMYIQKNVNAESSAVLNDFLMAWKGDSIFSVQEQEAIVQRSLSMIRKNAKPYPHFSRYLSCVLLMKKDAAKAARFSGWDKGFDKLVEDRKATLQAMDRYLIFVKQLADSNALFQSSTVEWRIASPVFRFVIDSTIHVLVDKTDLFCRVRKDSISILGTQGEFNPVTYTWKGKEGIVTWERAGFEREEVYAELANYSINMARAEYTARDVVFVNKLYFNAPLKGVLIDKVKFNKTPADADYPQFDSYLKDFKIKNLYKDIDFEGGLSMQGAKLVGIGNREKPAKVFIYRKDTLVLVASSNYFAFKKDRINAASAAIQIKLKNDSIFHHGLALSYILSGRELTLFRTDNFTSQSPYFDSYHNIDMSFEQLVWKMDEPVMRFTAMMGSQTGKAKFESVNFYNNDQFMSLQLMDEVNPLISIRSFAKRMGVEQFLATDYADYLKKPDTQVKQLLMRMAALGFLFYDTENDMATIRPRLHDYIAASVAKVDYDVISIPSNTNGPVENAIFDLRNYDLIINGIPRIFVSDSQNVVIYPAQDRIIMKKNRHFQFDGQVQAGLFTITGKNFFFNYDSFKIDLKRIDSLRIRYLTGQVDNYGFPLAEKAQNLLEDMKGVIYIDRPDNKSGRKSYPEYPVFVSKENAYVYYDDKNIFNGVYTRDRFFFRAEPFTMDSIDNFNRQSMKFAGELASADIFPLIKETLKLQPDKSLGFKHITPVNGLELYKGKGIFSNEFTLNNSGLTGRGTIRYLTSATASDNITFFPDSLNAKARDFTIAQKTSETQYPYVNSMNNSIHWLPYQDEMYAYQTDSSFRMFNSSTSLSGKLKLEPKGLSGSGRMFMEGAELSSDMYTYKANEINADTSDFYLKSLHSKGFTVLTENIDAHIDFAVSKGLFRSNEEFTLVSFPENKYVSFLDNFEWDMNRKILAMGSKSSAPQANQTGEEGSFGPRYISIDPTQDSLSFLAPIAFYDYDSNLIKATEVKFIDIADARIYPDHGKLTVQPDARLRTLFNASLIANRDTKYYPLYKATLNIVARNKYLGSANYNYVDEAEQQQIIYFSALSVDTSLQTIGTGEITSEDDFTLSPNYKYQGKVYMEANKPYLTFDGNALIEHNCEHIPSRWMHFRTEVDPKDVYLPVTEELIDIERNKIFNGIYMYYDSVHVYPAFLSGRKFSSDKAVVSATGFLHYDHEKQQYQIASKEKLFDPSSSGNLLTLHRENCEMYGEGNLNLGANLGQVKLTTVGNALHKTIENTTELNVVLGIDFFIANNIINVMAAEIDSIPSLPAVDINSTLYTKAVIDLIGKTRYDAMKSELSLFGTTKEIPAELKHTVLFNELKLRWDDESNSWVSVGKIGIGSINGHQINKRVNGLLEIQIKRSGDILDFYLEMDRRTWYYFGYTRGVMQVHSSNNEFLDLMKKLKPSEREQKVSSGESYIYMVSTDVKKNNFLRRYRSVKEGVQEIQNGTE